MSDIPFDQDLQELICCPVCRSELTWTGEALVCKGAECRRQYRVEDGIPILLKEESTVLEPEPWEQAISA